MVCVTSMLSLGCLCFCFGTYKLAKCGTLGRQCQNIERDLHSAARKIHCKFDVRPYVLSNVIGKSSKFSEGGGGGLLAFHKHAILLPHEVFAAMYSSNKQQFHRRLLAGCSDGRDCHEFWSTLASETWVVDHPYHEAITTVPSSCIPLRLHGDGAKGFRFISWISVMGARFFWRILVNGHYEDDMVDDLGDFEPDLAINWSFHALAQGDNKNIST